MQKLLFLFLTTAVVGVSGCDEKDSTISLVKIMPSIATRVTGVHFDDGDCIGLTIDKGSTPYVENRMMTYNGSAFTAEGLLWYNNQNEKSTLTAYHPYSSSGMPGEFTVAADQTTDYAQSDLLGARKENVTPGAAPVGMVFRHLLSEVRIVVTNNSDASVTGIMVGGSVPTAEADLSTLTVQIKSGVAAMDIKANCVTADASYRVILVPQQATLTFTVQTDDGKNRSKEISSAVLDGGKWYDVAIKVDNIDIAVSLSGDIEDWGEGGSLDGGGSAPDPAPDPGETLEYGGDTYRIKTIGARTWMAENLRFQPAGTTLGSGIWNPENGASAVAAQGLLYDYATATGGAVAAADAPMQGICPAGWHLPSSDELRSLIDADYGAGFFSFSKYWIVSDGGNKYGSKSCLMSVTLSNLSKCEVLMYDADGQNPVVETTYLKYGISVRCVKDGI